MIRLSFTGSICLLVLTIVLFSCKEGSSPDTEASTCLFESISSELLPCLDEYSEATLEVVTWNLQQFPLNGTSTIDELVTLLCNINADVVAVQEVKNHLAFLELANRLDDWEMKLLDLDGDLDLGFLFKKSEITSYTTPVPILPNAWPRSPAMTTIKHVSGAEVTLINLHLKCCGGSDNYNIRTSVSEQLKDYLDVNLADNPVIVLGDFNDHILIDSPFANFISDTDHYKFVDNEIALGSSEFWSYPSWPSHIDHIMISDELFESVISIKTIRLDQCFSEMETLISDHRPLLLSLE